jgi:glycosyltransferase involved in cell wall biosynthesis
MTDSLTASRAAFLLPNLEGGGAERVIVQLANVFSEKGIPVDLLLLQKTGVLLSEVSSRVNIIDMGLSSAYASLPKLIAYLKAVRPDVLLSALELTSLSTLLARRVSGVKTRVVIRVSVAISQHKRSPIKKIIERLLVSLMYPWADRIVAVSRETAQDLSKFGRIPVEKIRAIYNPVISDYISLQANEAVAHPFYQQGHPPLILGAGRLTPQKDFGTLIRAFDIVRRQIPAQLLILGEGDARGELEDLIRSFGLSDKVDLPGYVKNPFAYMKKSNVFVLSSRWEGLPNVLLQALACGCPVVSTDCPTGPMEILDEGRYGHLVPVGEPNALATAIIHSLHGDRRMPPPEWLEQFRVEPVARQYAEVMGLGVISAYPKSR